MLSGNERIAVYIMLVVFGGATAIGFYRMFRVVMRGRAAALPKGLPMKAMKELISIGTQQPMFRARPLLSTFHAFVFFGFTYFLLVNLNDVFEGFIPGYETYDLAFTSSVSIGGVVIGGAILGILNLLGDVLSVGVLFGMGMLMLRRLKGADKRLFFNDNVFVNPKAKEGGIKKDSLIVGTFIMFHIGARFFGQALRLAEHELFNPAQPFASIVAIPLQGLSEGTYTLLIHASWWVAIGLILVFFPYMVISKHVHLMSGPLNWILSRGQEKGYLAPAAPKDKNGKELEPGAATIDDLPWTRVLDAYACIMCSRCQDACPAYTMGQPLSPAALEINKRYYINKNFNGLAGGSLAPTPLLEMALPAEAIWACTTCYACVQVCPMGNEPMLDIIDMRRRFMVSSPDALDSGIQSTLETIAKSGNSFGKSARKRAAWTKGLDIEIKDLTKEPAEYLWFVGDYASFDPRVTPMTQQVAKIMQGAGVDFGILYKAEKNSGNDVRRVGEEGLFEMLVEDNLAAMGETEFKKIMTTDPHTLNTLRNEYPEFGGMWKVEHYTGMLMNLASEGKIKFTENMGGYLATYHDPCYLGRYNGGFDAPRTLMSKMGVALKEMPRSKENSFCCGAGGGQIWVGNTPDGERPAENRIREALDTLEGEASGRKLLFIVTCPKDVVMYTDAVKSVGAEDKIEVRDIIELVAEAMGVDEAEPEAVAG